MIWEITKWSTVGILLFITFQDFKYRGVSWWLFIPIAVAPWLQPGFVQLESLQTIFLNLGFLFVQLTLTLLYFRFKGISWKSLGQEYIGVGDLLFFLLLTQYGSLLNYIVFLQISLIFSLSFYYFYRLLSKTKSRLIPLAGLQSMCLAAVLISPIERYNDQMWIEWMV